VAAESDDLQASLGPAYTIERELGRGGMATVYLARDTKHGRRVALKVLHADLALSLGPERFQREIATAAQLQHPHILGVHDSGRTAGGQLWFTMPFVEGESLRDRLRRERQLPIDDAVRITREVAGALDYAHEQGVVHRDIKPENILLTKRGDALLADFGIARGLGAASGETVLTQTGLAVGTPQYMSPEQASGERNLDARSDVYALGAVCYEMLTGEPPFIGSSSQAILAKMLTNEPPSARVLRPGVAPAIDAAVRRALAPSPADRWPTAAAFSDALQRAAGTIEVPAMASATGSSTAPLTAPPAAASRRGPVPTGVALLGLGFLVGIGALFAWRSHAGVAGGSSAGPIRVAVLPFENVGDSADGYFADGMTDAVRAKLTSVPGIEVIGSASSGQYRRSTKTTRQIGEELGVRYLLVGKVRWDKQPGKESEVEVSPELVDAGTAAEKWAQPYDAPLTHVFQVQGEIAAKVAQSLQVALTPATQAALEKRPTANLDAYDAYLRGESWARRGSGQVGLRRAAAAYREAVTLDSTFALAWAGLADAQATLFYNSGLELANLPDSVNEESNRALALAPDLPEAHLARAEYYGSVRYNAAQAKAEAEAGLAHGPNALLLAALARTEEGLGEWDSAAAHATQATIIDPRQAATFRRLTEIDLWRRRPADAIVAGDRALAISPESNNSREWRMMASLQLGDLAGARALLRAAPAGTDLSAQAADIGLYWDLGWVLDSAAEARLLALRPAAFDNDTASWAIVLAQQYRFRGDSARARAYADTSWLAAVSRAKVHPLAPETRMFAALALSYMGRGPDAIRAIDSLITLRAQRPPSKRDIGYTDHLLVRVYLAAGKTDLALDVLEKLMAEPYFLTPAWLRIDPNFIPLHGNPRFEKLAGGTAPIA